MQDSFVDIVTNIVSKSIFSLSRVYPSLPRSVERFFLIFMRLDLSVGEA